MSEACAHCGGDTRLCTTLCCQECGEEDCRYVWAAYGWRAKHGLLSVVPNEACDALAVMLREAEQRRAGDAQRIVDELAALFGASADDLLRIVRHDHEYAAAWRARAEAADALTAAVTAMADKYGARPAGEGPEQWVKGVCRRLDALRDVSAQDADDERRALGIEHRREKST